MSKKVTLQVWLSEEVPVLVFPVGNTVALREEDCC